MHFDQNRSLLSPRGEQDNSPARPRGSLFLRPPAMTRPVLVPFFDGGASPTASFTHICIRFGQVIVRDCCSGDTEVVGYIGDAHQPQRRGRPVSCWVQTPSSPRRQMRTPCTCIWAGGTPLAKMKMGIGPLSSSCPPSR